VLEYDEDEGIIWVTPMLISETLNIRTKDIVISVDDCDCEQCVIERGGISIDRSIYVKVPTDNGKTIRQRLSIEEANMLGRALIAYSENLDNMIEEE